MPNKDKLTIRKTFYIFGKFTIVAQRISGEPDPTLTNYDDETYWTNVRNLAEFDFPEVDLFEHTSFLFSYNGRIYKFKYIEPDESRTTLQECKKAIEDIERYPDFNKYDIYFTTVHNDDGYSIADQFIGSRLETDEECAMRIEKEKIEARERKARKTREQEAKRQAKAERLRRELERIENG